jgi:hypothetical protein
MSCKFALGIILLCGVFVCEAMFPTQLLAFYTLTINEESKLDQLIAKLRSEKKKSVDGPHVLLKIALIKSEYEALLLHLEKAISAMDLQGGDYKVSKRWLEKRRAALYRESEARSIKESILLNSKLSDIGVKILTQRKVQCQAPHTQTRY